MKPVSASQCWYFREAHINFLVGPPHSISITAYVNAYAEEFSETSKTALAQYYGCVHNIMVTCTMYRIAEYLKRKRAVGLQEAGVAAVQTVEPADKGVLSNIVWRSISSTISKLYIESTCKVWTVIIRGYNSAQVNNESSPEHDGVCHIGTILEVAKQKNVGPDADQR